MKLQGGRGGGGPGGGGGRPPGKPLIGNGGLGTDPGGGGIEPGGGLRGYRTVDAAVWRRRSDDSSGDGRADGWTPSPRRTTRRWRAAGAKVGSRTPLTYGKPGGIGGIPGIPPIGGKPGGRGGIGTLRKCSNTNHNGPAQLFYGWYPEYGHDRDSATISLWVR